MTSAFATALNAYAAAFREATGSEHDQLYPGAAVDAIRGVGGLRVDVAVLEACLVKLGATGRRPTRGELADLIGPHLRDVRLYGPVEARWLRAARELVERRGWPTGVTFRRGSHSGTFVADPLGYDPRERAPAELEAPRPTLYAIAKALREVANGS